MKYEVHQNREINLVRQKSSKFLRALLFRSIRLTPLGPAYSDLALVFCPIRVYKLQNYEKKV